MTNARGGFHVAAQGAGIDPGKAFAGLVKVATLNRPGFAGDC